MQFLTRILILWVALAGLAVVADDDSPAEVKQQLQALQGQIRDQRARLAEAQGEAGQLEAELARLETRIGVVAQRLRETAQHLNVEHARLEDLGQRKRQQLRELAHQRAALARQVRAGYVIGRQGKLKLLLNQQDPQAVGRILVYYNYINRLRGRRINEVKQSLGALRRLEYEIGAQTRQLRQVASQLRRQHTELARAREQRAQVLADLREEMETTGRSIDVLVKDGNELKRLLESIQTALADIPASVAAGAAFDTLKGKLPWPSPGPIEAQFGNLRTEGADMIWQGVVIGADMGAEVRAVAGGRVAFAEWMRGFGLLMIIDHGEGYMSLYGHNQSLYKSVGDWVEASELIARVGDSGGLTASGLYFEIRHEGEPLNPALWCAAKDQITSPGGS